MPHSSRTILTLTICTLAGMAHAATPILPDATIATNAVKAALQPPAAAETTRPTPVATPAAKQELPAAVAAFQQTVAPRLDQVTPTVATTAQPTGKSTVTASKSTTKVTVAATTKPTAPVKATTVNATTVKATTVKATTPKATTPKATTPKVTTTAKTTPPNPTAAQVRQQNIARLQQAAAARATGRTAIVRSTAYNSLVGQTDSTPFITATGTRTRFGVIALSRDLLRSFPYGTRVRIEDLSGQYNAMLRNQVFIVEDTMHPRKTNQIDIWMSTRSQALQWGARSVRITAVR